MESILAEYGIQGGSLALALAFLWYTIKGNRKASDDAHRDAKIARGKMAEKQDAQSESITVLATKFDAHTEAQHATNKRHSSSIKDLYQRVNSHGGSNHGDNV